MPPSQLKQLKASLREHGLIGPQKSKKQREAVSRDATKRNQRNAALNNIRDRFNPFEVKAPTRREKFEVATNKESKKSLGRPGVTKGLGEERRRATLLKEIQSRNKIGGLLDRRFGENDPTMTPEQRAAERFARQSQKRLKKSSIFNLEVEDDGEMQLTHGGQTLSFADDVAQDDFQEKDIIGSDEELEDGDLDGTGDRPRKRMRLDVEERTEDEAAEHDMGQLPERKKTKQEVMKEVIAKSKLHKYERQQAKEDDDDLRAELDKGMSEFYEAIRSQAAPPKPSSTQPSNDSEPVMNPERAAILAGKDREIAEKEYNERLRQMALDARSKPSSRTKTEEEKAVEEAERLKDLEKKRLRRMQGEPESSDDEDEAGQGIDVDREQDDAEIFGLTQPLQAQPRPELDVEDEDEFLVDDDLIASDPDAEFASGSDSDVSDDESEAIDDGDDDFINGLVLPESGAEHTDRISGPSDQLHGNLAFTYPCPESHEEFLRMTEGKDIRDLPTIVQRIRALYHPRLAEDNKTRLERFAAVLTEHIAYLADQDQQVLPSVLESLIRHLHSMAKAQPEAVGSSFRTHLRKIADERPLKLTKGDLILLTGISTIFPTSDQFHSVVTPAMLTIARYLGQTPVQSLYDLGIGAYTCSLALQYQEFSKRYVPEVIVYATNAVVTLAPVPIPEAVINATNWPVPVRLPTNSLRIKRACPESPQPLKFSDLCPEPKNPDAFAASLLGTFVKLLSHAAQLWQSKTAFYEIFAEPLTALNHILSNKCCHFLRENDRKSFKAISEEISALCQKSLQSRKPLFLHNHRPLAIKTFIPKFEENFNPERHYDPDRERSELNKLKAEHKRERKGALRELRKDANFMARESLKEKKQRDAAYEKKFKRLVAEIQGEEGREAKEYERERRKRKGRW